MFRPFFGVCVRVLAADWLVGSINKQYYIACFECLKRRYYCNYSVCVRVLNWYCNAILSEQDE